MKNVLLASAIALTMACSNQVTDDFRSDSLVTDDVDESLELILTKPHLFPKKIRKMLRDGTVWKAISSFREKKLERYDRKHAEAREAFLKAPVATNGVPAILFKALPEILPNYWGSEGISSFTGLYYNEGEVLPHGMAFTNAGLVDGNPTPTQVQFTCGACHSNQVQLENGEKKLLVGAPSTRFDINGYRTLLGMSIQSPDFNATKIGEILDSKPLGSLYGAENEAAEMTDRYIFSQIGEALVEGFKKSVLDKAQLTVHVHQLIS